MQIQSVASRTIGRRPSLAPTITHDVTDGSFFLTGRIEQANTKQPYFQTSTQLEMNVKTYNLDAEVIHKPGFF